MTLRRLALVVACACGCSRNESPPPSEPATSSSQAATPSPTPARSDAPAGNDAPAPVTDPPAPAPDVDAAKPDAKPPARSFDDVQGLTTAELVAHWGEPDAKTSERWTYKFPRKGCTEERLVYVLSLHAGKVAKIDRRTEQTGKVCEPIE